MGDATDAPRVRNASSTRAAILVSARAAFANASYDAVGLREIAAGAGVTAMLVNRYFGSKEGLFAAVVEDTMRTPTVLTRENLASESPSRVLARALVDATDSDSNPLEGFLIMVHSASNPVAAAISRAQTEEHHLRSLAGVIAGGHAAERAAMALSVIAGFQVMRQLLGLSPLADAEPAVLVELLQNALRPLLEPA